MAIFVHQLLREMKVFASILLFSVLLSGSVIASGETIVLEGHYQNKNLYVTNCFGEDGVGFAVSAVRVNGEVTSDAVTSSAFEINLTDFGLTMGDQDLSN